MPTRFRKLGVAGPTAGAFNSRQRSAGSLSDPFFMQYVIDVPLSLVGIIQRTGFRLPRFGILNSLFMRILNPAVGTLPTIDIGISFGDPVQDDQSRLASGIVLANAGCIFTGTDVGADLHTGTDEEAEITYTLGSDGGELTGLEAELVLSVFGSDV